MRIPLWIFLSLALFLPLLTAQDSPTSGEPNRESERPIQGTGRLESMEKWTIKPQLETLERAMRDYEPLLETLHQANADVGADLKHYLQNPDDRVSASRVQVKLSSYARSVVTAFDRVIGKQDLLLSTFREVEHRLERFSTHIGYKAIVYEKQHTTFQGKGKKIAKELHDLATRIRESDDPKEQEARKREFRRRYLSWRIHNRYVKGYDRTRQQYEKLSKHLAALARVARALSRDSPKGAGSK